MEDGATITAAQDVTGVTELDQATASVASKAVTEALAFAQEAVPADAPFSSETATCAEEAAPPGTQPETAKSDSALDSVPDSAPSTARRAAGKSAVPGSASPRSSVAMLSPAVTAMSAGAASPAPAPLSPGSSPGNSLPSAFGTSEVEG